MEEQKYIHWYKIEEFGSKNNCFIAHAKTGIYGIKTGGLMQRIKNIEIGEKAFIVLNREDKRIMGIMYKVGSESVNFKPSI